MRVRSIGSNQIEVEKNNGTFLVSYSTVVAARLPGFGCVRTEDFWSVTTSKHINRWLAGADGKKIPQKDLEKLFDR